MDLKNIALNIYSFGLSAGFINKNDMKIDLNKLVELAKTNNLGGVEFPIDHFFDLSNIGDGIDFIHKTAKSGLSVFIDIEKIDKNYLEKVIPALSDQGHIAARIKMQHIGKVFYGGNRYSAKEFNESVNNFKTVLKQLLPLLEKYSFKLLIENHQDLSSLELAAIINEVSPEHVGVNWDIGNSYSVLDTPDSFLSHAGKYIGNVHLKDYRIIKTDNGYRLLRCALGDGVIKFGELIPTLINDYNISNMSIELGAQIGRECNVNFDAYWNAYETLPVNRDEFLNEINNIADEDSEKETLYESGGNIEQVMQLEYDEFKKSVHYLQSL